MSEIYFNRKGITHQVELLVFEAGEDTIIWEAKVDGDSFYFETSTSFEVSGVIELAQKTYNDVLDSEEEKTIIDPIWELGKALGISLDNEFSEFNIALDRLTNSEQVKAISTEAKDYHTELVLNFIKGMGFSPEEVLSILIRPREISFSVRYEDGHSGFETFPFETL